MFYAIVALIAMILDQMLKYWTGTNIPLNATDGPVLIPGLLRLTNLHNTGAAFSLLAGGKFTWFFVLLCIVFVAAVVYALRNETIKSQPARWAAVMVMAGAVGNCADRVINTTVDAAGYSHYVVDMFELIPFSFPVFNLADIYITLGAIVFCIVTLLEKSDEEFAQEDAGFRGAKGNWNVRRTYAGRDVAPEETLYPDEEEAPERDIPAAEVPRGREFREWKVMQGPDAPPPTEYAPEADREEERDGDMDVDAFQVPEADSPGRISYSRPAPRRGPGGEAAFRQTEAAVRSVQSSAQRPKTVGGRIPAGQGKAAAAARTRSPGAGPARQGGPLFSKTEQVVRTLAKGAPPPSVPPATASKGSTSASSSTGRAPAVENESYDLDDILAEFRDS